MNNSISQIAEHMDVLGSDGHHVGTVDRVEGSRIKLTRSDDPDGTGQHHHFLPMSAVSKVENGAVRLTVPAKEAKETALRSGAA